VGDDGVGDDGVGDDGMGDDGMGETGVVDASAADVVGGVGDELAAGPFNGGGFAAIAGAGVGGVPWTAGRGGATGGAAGGNETTSVRVGIDPGGGRPVLTTRPRDA
jgi:hypothetical protein